MNLRLFDCKAVVSSTAFFASSKAILSTSNWASISFESSTASVWALVNKDLIPSSLSERVFYTFFTNIDIVYFFMFEL